MIFVGLIIGGFCGFIGATILIASSDTFYHENRRLKTENRVLRRRLSELKRELERIGQDSFKTIGINKISKDRI